MESLTFQPNKKGVISGCTIPVIFVLGYVAYAMFPDGYKILTKGELVFECVLVTVVVFGYAAALVYIIKSAGYRTMIEVSQQGFAVVDHQAFGTCVCTMERADISVYLHGRRRL